MAHLNRRGEVCHCGFGKFQPSVDWHMGAAQLVEPPNPHSDPNFEGFHMEPGRPFFYDEQSNEIIRGPEGSTHYQLEEDFPNIGSEGLPMGRQHGDRLEWYQPPAEGASEVEEALGAKSEEGDSGWDFTEPMASEPDSEQRQHDVQIGNDEPGVPTIGA